MEEKKCSIVLKSASNKVKVIQAYRELSGKGLKESKQLIDNTPAILFDCLSEGQAKFYMQKIKGADSAATWR